MPAAGFELDSHVFFWLTQVIAARDRELAQGLREFGLRVPEWRALAALYGRQRETRGCTMSELADLATIDRTTLTRTIDRMEQAGWLARRADDEDMRVTRLALTAAGKKMFDRLWPTVQRLNDLAIAGLPRSEIQLLQKILGRMRANLEAYVGEPHAG
jgi:DNA-binding MarR family transcriptional regulator